MLSTVAVSGARGAEPFTALTNGYQAAFAVAIVFAALGMVTASLPLGRSREPKREPVAQAEPAVA